MSVNLNDALPAAPAGRTNVLWQSDISGNISANVGDTASQITASNIDLLAQSADIVTDNILLSAEQAVYRVSIYIIITQAATTSSTLPNVEVFWTDNDNVTSQTFILTPASPSANDLNTYAQGSMVLNAQLGSSIQYDTTGYASSGGTSMEYALHIRLEKL